MAGIEPASSRLNQKSTTSLVSDFKVSPFGLPLTGYQSASRDCLGRLAPGGLHRRILALRRPLLTRQNEARVNVAA